MYTLSSASTYDLLFVEVTAWEDFNCNDDVITSLQQTCVLGEREKVLYGMGPNTHTCTGALSWQKSLLSASCTDHLNCSLQLCQDNERRKSLKWWVSTSSTVFASLKTEAITFTTDLTNVFFLDAGGLNFFFYCCDSIFAVWLEVDGQSLICGYR